MQETPPLEQTAPPNPHFWLRLKRRLLAHVWVARIGLILAVIMGVAVTAFLFSFILGRLGVANYLHLAGDFIFAPTLQLKSQNGRTNLLILGKSGAGHDSPDLTDTIILASIAQMPPSIDLISIPRDIWIPEIRAKINSAYYWGKQKEAGGGLKLAKSLVEEITGLPVHYGLVVDFDGFTEIIDVVGGIEVNVEHAFIDEKYPIAGKEKDMCGGDRELKCRYETLHFAQGKQIMDGATALKFVRSRNAQGDEGTDLARAARQQKVLVAIRQEILKPSTYLSPVKLWRIWQVVKKSVETDFNPSAAAILARRAFNARDKIISRVLSEDLLTHPPVSEQYDFQYVFIPKAGTWKEIHNAINCLLDINCSGSR